MWTSIVEVVQDELTGQENGDHAEGEIGLGFFAEPVLNHSMEKHAGYPETGDSSRISERQSSFLIH